MMKPLFVRLALAAFALVGTCVGLEAVLRVATGSRLLSVEPKLAPRGINYAPGQRARFKGPEWDVEIAINAMGFRDEERSPATTSSVVVLGSSFVEGHGVALADSFAKKLQAALPGTWVYNGGHHGTTMARQLRTYREVFRGIADCRTVILAFCVAQDIDGPGSADVAPPQFLTSPARVFLSEHSALYNLVNRRVKSSAVLRRAFQRVGLLPTTGDVLAVPPYNAAATRPLLDHTLGEVRQLAAEVVADGRRFVVALLPMKEQVDRAFCERLLAESSVPRDTIDLDGAYTRARDELAKAGLTVVDLTAALTAACFFEHDRHYAPAGHAAIGRALAAALAR